MPGESWSELAKNYVLWESQKSGNIEVMLQRTDTNTRTNQRLARFSMSVQRLTSCWLGNYKNLYGDVYAELEEHYMTMEAYSRKQAIELASAVARASAPSPGEPEQKKRGGILGLFGR
jgi:hypothetical protein